jgi:hypothetical protein
MTRKYSSISVETTLASGINTTQTTMQVVSSAAATSLLGGQTLAAGNVDIFTVVIDPDTASEEIVFITDVSGDTFTISRGQAGTGSAGVSGIAHSAGATVRHVLTSSDLNYFRDGLPSTISTAKGDLVAATAANTVTRLAVGTNGQYLKADSTAATGVAWTTFPALGKIGQVVTASAASNTSTTSSSFVDVTNFTASITPSSASSKVVVICDFQTYLNGLMGSNTGGVLTFGYFAITRGTTVIYQPASVGFYSSSAGSNDITLVGRSPMVYVDSPSTTSSTTYKLQVKSNGSAVTTQAGTGTITLMEVLP